MSLFETAALLLLGCAAGIVSTIAGGAGVLTTPALIFFGHAPINASATGFIALSPASFAAAWVDRKRLTGVTRAHKIVCVVSFLGAVAGGAALLATGEALFRAMIPGLLGLATLLYWIAPHAQRLVAAREGESYPPGMIAAFGAAGVYSGYFGTGYGVVLLALLRAAGVADYVRANMLKNLIGAIASAGSVLFFANTTLVHWPTAATMIVGNVAGGVMGARLARVLPGEAMRRGILAAGVLLTALMARRFWLS